MKNMIILAVLLSLGCSAKKTEIPSSQSYRISELEQKISGIENEFASYKKISDKWITQLKDQQGSMDLNLTSIQTDIIETKEAVRFLELLRKSTASSPTPLKVTKKGYGTISSNIGYFLISAEDVQPYLEGYKITLKIGNPSAMTFNGMTINLVYPSLKSTTEGEGSTSKSFLDYSNNESSVSQFTEKFYPGRWTKIVVSLPRLSLAQLENLSGIIQANQVLLPMSPDSEKE